MSTRQLSQAEARFSQLLSLAHPSDTPGSMLDILEALPPKYPIQTLPQFLNLVHRLLLLLGGNGEI